MQRLLVLLLATTGCFIVDESTEQAQPTGEAARCATNPVAGGRTGLRRLTRAQYAHTVRDLLRVQIDSSALPADGRAGPFSANDTSPVSDAHVRGYAELAERAAQTLTDDPASLTRLVPCAAAPTAACAESFLRDFARRAYRRPVSEETAAALLAGPYAVGAEESFGRGIALAVEAVLGSPAFV